MTAPSPLDLDQPLLSPVRRARRGWIFGGLLLLLVLLAGGVAARLLLFPVGLDVHAFAAPRLVAAVRAVDPATRLSLGQLTAWRKPWSGLIEVTARDVTVQRPGTGTAEIALLRLTLDEKALLKRQLMVREIAVRGVRGRLSWSVGTLLTWLKKTDPNAGIPVLPWRQGLRSFTVREAELTLQEATTGAAHQVRARHISLSADAQTPDRLRGSAAVSLQKSGKEALPLTVRATLTGRVAGDWVADLQIDVPPLNALLGPLESPLREHLPAAMRTARLEAPIQGRLWLTAQPFKPRIPLINKADVLDVRARLTVGAGTVALGHLWPTALPIQKGFMRLGWRDGVLDVPKASLTLADVAFEGRGRWQQDQPAQTMFRLFAPKLTMAQLVTLWPPAKVAGGRRWVAANIAQGVAHQVTLQQKPGQPLAFGFDFSHLEVHYRRPMPPVRHAYGRARLQGDALLFAVKGGALAGLTLDPSQVTISALAQPHKERLQVDINARGAASALLQILDSPPLGYISGFGLNPQAVGGDARIAVTLTMPLIRHLTFADVDFKGRAHSSGLSLANAVAGQPLTQGHLLFNVTRSGLRAQGPLLLGTAPLTIDWRERFGPGGPEPATHLTAAGRMTAVELARLGADLTDYVSGPLGVAMDGTGAGLKLTNLNAALDLRAASLRVPGLGRVKPAGAAGRADVRLILAGERLRTVSALTLETEALSANAAFWPDRSEQGGAPGRLELHRVRFAETLFAGEVSFAARQPTRVRLTSDALDVAQVRRALIAGAETGQSVDPAALVKLDIRAKQAKLTPKLTLTELHGVAHIGGGIFQQGEVTARTGRKTGEDAPITGTLKRQGTGYKLTITTPDSGAFLSSLQGQSGMIAAGPGRLEADIAEEKSLWQMEGVVSIAPLRLARAPLLAQILASASFTGLADTLNGRGVSFDRAEAKFRWRDGVLRVHEASARGAGLGLTAEGEIDASLTRSTLRGVIVPLYALNSIFGKIPLLGEVLGGGQHQGLLGVNYRIEGPFMDPVVRVNPVSVFTPGVLRQLFKGRKPKLPPQTAAVPKLKVTQPE